MMDQDRRGDGARTATWALLVDGLLLGVGLMGALDTVLFHQILQWHNFYVHADEYWRIASDGLLHLATTTLLFLGALRLWDDRRLLSGAGGRTFAAAIILGMGAFQLFDGTVDHLLFRFHPPREGASPRWPYDVAWNASALLMLAVGWLLWRRARASSGTVEQNHRSGR